MAAAWPALGPPSIPEWEAITAPEVFGVLIWVGDAGSTPPPTRTIGTMMFTPGALLTFHSHSTEVEILGNDVVSYSRVSAEVFQHFQNYPRAHQLGPWVRAVSDGESSPGTFEDVIELQRSDGELRTVYLTMRGVQVAGERLIRGIIHDISDVQPPAGEVGYGRRGARAVARAVAQLMPEGSGVAHVDFLNRVILEWLVDPPAPLQEWKRTIEEWEDPDQLANQIRVLMSGEAETVSFTAGVRLAASDRFTPVRIILTEANLDDAGGNGMMAVQVVAAGTADAHEGAAGAVRGGARTAPDVTG